MSFYEWWVSLLSLSDKKSKNSDFPSEDLRKSCNKMKGKIFKQDWYREREIALDDFC